MRHVTGDRVEDNTAQATGGYTDNAAQETGGVSGAAIAEAKESQREQGCQHHNPEQHLMAPKIN